MTRSMQIVHCQSDRATGAGAAGTGRRETACGKGGTKGGVTEGVATKRGAVEAGAGRGGVFVVTRGRLAATKKRGTNENKKL